MEILYPKIFLGSIPILEPVGYTPPRLPPKSKLDAVQTKSKRAVVMPCDAQANPLPTFRSVDQTYLYECMKLQNPKQALPLQLKINRYPV